jgi:ribonuclease HI
MYLIAIDGACRRNGKPDCISAAGVFIVHYNEKRTKTISTYELNSTNQRGELHALILALNDVVISKEEVQIVTDSEYVFNAVTKEWFNTWAKRGWTTALGDPVKNKDLWLIIQMLYEQCADNVHMYHIKGHCLAFGKVTAKNLLHQDDSGYALYRALCDKVDSIKNYEEIADLSVKNNGFDLTLPILRRFVICNTVADAIATNCVEAAEALS